MDIKSHALKKLELSHFGYQ